MQVHPSVVGMRNRKDNYMNMYEQLDASLASTMIPSPAPSPQLWNAGSNLTMDSNYSQMTPNHQTVDPNYGQITPNQTLDTSFQLNPTPSQSPRLWPMTSNSMNSPAPSPQRWQMNSNLNSNYRSNLSPPPNTNCYMPPMNQNQTMESNIQSNNYITSSYDTLHNSEFITPQSLFEPKIESYDHQPNDLLLPYCAGGTPDHESCFESLNFGNLNCNSVTPPSNLEMNYNLSQTSDFNSNLGLDNEFKNILLPEYESNNFGSYLSNETITNTITNESTFSQNMCSSGIIENNFTQLQEFEDINDIPNEQLLLDVNPQSIQQLLNSDLSSSCDEITIAPTLPNGNYFEHILNNPDTLHYLFYLAGSFFEHF